MNRKKVGNTDVMVSEIGIGTWEMSGDVWGPKEDEESLRALASGVESGARFIDTAAGYGAGHVEELVGRFLRESSLRDELVISTKVKPQCGEFAPPPGKPIRDFYSRSWIRDQCEGSLRRLNRDYVDILFLHTWSRSWDHELEWWETLEELRQEGKVRAIGISVPDEGITDANTHVALDRIDAVQCVYNVFQQEPEHSLLPLAEVHGTGIIARSPFSSGVLVGDWTPDMGFAEGDWRASWPLEIHPGWLEEQIKMTEHARPLLEKSGLPFAVAALKFILRQPAVSSVIPGSANPGHVRENMSAANGSSLPADIAAELEDLWSSRAIHGTYNGSI